ncbi:ABC transporter ATP-binding protein [Formosa sp. L2A11]|uniref:ABC transporter ATP-binding protein n=1 Tax=Formosa sp. L2A11 TaxID=2686363 RepID=UPI00131DCFF8|nr:ABC transporter ATP-binding protein [Formosa sp. L2A11]
MSKPVIKLENLSKQYRLGTIGTGTIAHDLNRWWQTKVFKREDPYLKVGDTNDRSHKGDSEYVWALRNLNLEIEEGDVIGIIGRNGAGKSTLLKLLSKITSPTTGSIKIKGRLASLLEVGTGFHPELTGRENIYLNGAILGMTKAEVTSKLEEIIEFSGCARYIDTPVKRYSSGMTVRVGFAVAAFLEPEILVVDEVLAVGDAEFQKKAIGKMKSVSQEGRTVLFVSHNMASIKNLCSKGVLLSQGSVEFVGTAEETVEYYLKQDAEAYKSGKVIDKGGSKDIEILDYKTFRKDEESRSFYTGDQLTLKIELKFNEFIGSVDMGINFNNANHELITHITNLDEHVSISGNKGDSKTVTIVIDSINLAPDSYRIDIGLMADGKPLHILENCFEIDIQKGPNIGRLGVFPKHVKVFTPTKWQF